VIGFTVVTPDYAIIFPGVPELSFFGFGVSGEKNQFFITA